MAFSNSYRMGGIFLFFIFLLSPLDIRATNANIPSTLDGPFEPETVPYDASLRGNSVDIPDTDPLVRRRVTGFEPEQLSVSLSFNHDSIWITWITGWFQSFILLCVCF